jgi:hypothetical protein
LVVVYLYSLCFCFHFFPKMYRTLLTPSLCGIGCRSTSDCQNGGSNQCIYCSPATRTCVNPTPLCGGYCPSMLTMMAVRMFIVLLLLLLDYFVSL